MKIRIAGLIALLAAVAFVGAEPGAGAIPPTTQCRPAAAYPAATTPVAFWSTEARCAIVPAGPGGVFGTENFGNKFPGEAAVYMGIVHVAIYDAAVAIEGVTSSTRPRCPRRRERRPRRRSRPRPTTRSPGCSHSSARIKRSSTTTTARTWPPSRTGQRRSRRPSRTGSNSASRSPKRSSRFV